MNKLKVIKTLQFILLHTPLFTMLTINYTTKNDTNTIHFELPHISLNNITAILRASYRHSYDIAFDRNPSQYMHIVDLITTCLPFMFRLLQIKMGTNTVFPSNNLSPHVRETLHHLISNNIENYVESFTENNISTSSIFQDIRENPYTIDNTGFNDTVIKITSSQFDYKNFSTGIENIYGFCHYISQLPEGPRTCYKTFTTYPHQPLLTRTWPIKLPYTLYLYIVGLMDYNVHPNLKMLNLLITKYTELSKLAYFRKPSNKFIELSKVILTTTETQLYSEARNIRWENRKSQILYRYASRYNNDMGM